MIRPRFTIARWMNWTAVLAVNAGLVRAFIVQDMFGGVILIFGALQVGFWCLRHSHGRARRFWLGFEISGVSAVLALVLCEIFPDSAPNRLVMSYLDFAGNLAFSHLPAWLSDYYLDEHWELFLAVVWFAPEWAAAILGGVIAVFLPRAVRRAARTPPRDEPSSFFALPPE
jgi:hypothetical protein